MQSVVGLALNEVKAFRGYDVVVGEVLVSPCEFVRHLDESYGEAVICNLNVKPGEALQKVAPIRFTELLGEFQQELQNDLRSQLASGNDVDCEFH